MSAGCRLDLRPRERRHPSPTALLSIALFLQAAPAAEKLSDDKIGDLEMELMDANSSKAADILKPYLAEPDPRLGPLIAEVLSRKEEGAADVRDKLFEALLRIADENCFKPAKKMLESNDIDQARRGVHLMARTKHPEAAASIVEFFKRTQLQELQLEALIALGELGDRSALRFVSETAGSAKEKELRAEATIAAIRLGSQDGLKEMVNLYTAIREKLYSIVVILNWQSHADPKGFKKNMRDVAQMKGELARIEAAFAVASREHAQAVLDLLSGAEKPDELDIYYTHIPALVAALPAEQAARLAEHPSSVLSLRAMDCLAAKGPEGRQAVVKAAERLSQSPDPLMRERALRLARYLAPDRAEELVRKGLADTVYRCREAAVKSALYLPAARRKDLVASFLEDEPTVRLRDTARWVLENPEARTALP